MLDFICLTETWMTNDSLIISTNKIDSNSLYHTISCPRFTQLSISELQRAKQGGGLTILISKNFSPKPPLLLELPYFHPKPGLEIASIDQKLELMIIRAYPHRLPRGYTCCIIVNVYLPEFESIKTTRIIHLLIDY